MTPNGDSDGRFARLREGVSHLGRSRRPLGRWLMVAGAALMAAGIAIIILGWVGASHTPYVFEQVPYVISGGLLGAAIALLGGLMYFAYWMTRNLEESRSAAQATQDALGRIEQLLGARTNGVAQANGGGNAQANSAATRNGAPFVKTPRGSMFHRPDCAAVLGRDGLVPVSASGEGYAPCAVCEPLATV